MVAAQRANPSDPQLQLRACNALAREALAALAWMFFPPPPSSVPLSHCICRSFALRWRTLRLLLPRPGRRAACQAPPPSPFPSRLRDALSRDIPSLVVLTSLPPCPCPYPRPLSAGHPVRGPGRRRPRPAEGRAGGCRLLLAAAARPGQHRGRAGARVVPLCPSLRPRCVVVLCDVAALCRAGV